VVQLRGLAALTLKKLDLSDSLEFIVFSFILLPHAATIPAFPKNIV